MDFYIKKGSTLPRLTMELINDGRNDYDKFHDLIQNCAITFCMTDTNTGVKRIGGKAALCILKNPQVIALAKNIILDINFQQKKLEKLVHSLVNSKLCLMMVQELYWYQLEMNYLSTSLRIKFLIYFEILISSFINFLDNLFNKSSLSLN